MEMHDHPPGVLPHFVVDGAVKAIDFYVRAFGAVEVRRSPIPDGRLMHAEIRIGISTVYLSDDFPEYRGGKKTSPHALGGTPITLHQYVADCDAAVAKAVAAGASIVMPPSDCFWGDRYGQVMDPFGHVWSFAHRLPAERAKVALDAWMAHQKG
jgi:PhnB protein